MPNEEEIAKTVSHPNHISGIHNYYDHWCKRCSMTARCLACAMEQADKAGRPASDESNAAFWGGVQNSLSAVLTLLQSKMDAHNIGD